MPIIWNSVLPPCLRHQTIVLNQKNGDNMRLCRFDNDRLGIVEGEHVLDVTAALDVIPPSNYPLPTYDLLIANLGKVCDRAKQLAANAQRKDINQVQLLS